MDINVVPKADLRVRYNRVGKSAFLIRESCGFELNELGREIWSKIDGIASVEDIARAIASAYDEESDQVVQDVVEFLGELKKNHLITLQENL
ncbi:PqqD family protein [Bombiscardovia coagulans]|uniref:Coenzyme PQQ synthesis protein D (PqqD) n=1 Tax=Bombiscardovia coagulans TaxID=686666 RepID=A0A261EVG5_9BIFI|nr:PqqD family protein [Bombiscardovia coagulans]OZG50861.1 Coenzyme PQQ synthesis protein D (PqqD) [Bombiscardovia coagulans]